MSKRPRRSCAKAKAPSASHYVGYVEDGESIESIMKKFEVLESYIEKNQQPMKTQTEETASMFDKGKEPREDDEEDALSCFKTEDEMEEFFKRTSVFSVEGALNGNALLYSDIDQIPELQLMDMFSDEEVESLSDDDDDYARVTVVVRRQGRRAPGAKREPRKPKYLSCEVTGPNGFKYVVRKKIRYVDPTLPVYQRVPSPLPLSWAKRIRPLQREENVMGCNYIEVESVNVVDLSKFGLFQGILMNPASVSDVAALDISDSVMPQGLAFVWAEKEDIAELFKHMASWGFEYVENFCWVKQGVNNKRMRGASDFFRKSKLSLIIFRKRNTQTTDTLELRHQRNPDVVWDFVRRVDGHPSRPEFIYHVIETLLPAARYSEATKRGELLELWAPPRTRRSGWTHVVQRFNGRSVREEK